MSPNPAPTTLLTARGLRKSYGPKPALKGIDLDLRAGEMVALLGPNGAGKSTLLQLLTGLFTPDASVTDSTNVITVDLSGSEIGDVIHINDIELPNGVKPTARLRGSRWVLMRPMR